MSLLIFQRTLRACVFIALIKCCLLTIPSLETTGTQILGQRQSNDRLLYCVVNTEGDQRFFSFSFGNPEMGPRVTAVEIYVRKAFNQTQAYISSGGIGQRSIIVILAVLSKTTISYEALIYGLDDLK